MAKVKSTKYIWINGKLVKWKDAKIHIMTHALHYGAAAFEGIRAYDTERGTAVFRINDHINRLFYSANSLGMKLKFSNNQIKAAIKKLLVMNKLKDAYIRPIAYYGYGDVEVYPKNIPCGIAIMAFQEYDNFSMPLRVMASKYRRYSDKSLVSGAKISGNYANSIMAMREARRKGYDEALMLDPDGYVSEGPSENIFMVKNGKLISPASKSALYGITRDSIIKISRDLKIKFAEKKAALKELKKADELFFCGTAIEVAPISSVDGKKIGNGKIGKVTSLIKNKYNSIVRGNDERYAKWLYYVN